MRKFRLYLDKDKETAWLNEMSAQGWAAKGFFAGFYQFEACEKGEYVYQIDFGTKLFAASEDYRELSLSRHGGIGLFSARKPRREILSCIQMSPRG